jgi:hypothetical protein
MQTMTEQSALLWEGGTVVAVRPVPVPESRPGWVSVSVGEGMKVLIEPGQARSA